MSDDPVKTWAPRVRSPNSQPLEVVVDGTDGAGKTHCVQFVLDQLTKHGWRVASCAPYKEREVYPLWESQPLQAAQIIVEIMNRYRRERSDVDVFVWDRGWPTAFVSTVDPQARRVFEPIPPLTVLLLSTVERTRAKVQSHRLTGEWVSSDALVQHYNAAYHNLELPPDCDVLRALPNRSALFDFWQIARWIELRLEELIRRC